MTYVCIMQVRNMTMRCGSMYSRRSVFNWPQSVTQSHWDMVCTHPQICLLTVDNLGHLIGAFYPYFHVQSDIERQGRTSQVGVIDSVVPFSSLRGSWLVAWNSIQTTPGLLSAEFFAFLISLWDTFVVYMYNFICIWEVNTYVWENTVSSLIPLYPRESS